MWRIASKARLPSNISSLMRLSLKPKSYQFSSSSSSSTPASSVSSGGSSFLQRCGAFLSGVGLTSLYGIYILQEENKKIHKSLQEIKGALGK